MELSEMASRGSEMQKMMLEIIFYIKNYFGIYDS